MKKHILFVCVFTQTWCLCAGTMQEAFLRGNAAYMAGNIDEALNFYQSIDPKGPAILYNMGNCYYRLNKYFEAIVQWRRAQKNASWHDAAMLEKYIEQAYRASDMTYETSLLTTTHIFFMRCGLLCSLFVLQLLFLCSLFVLCMMLPKLLKQARYYWMTLALIWMLCLIVVMFIKYRDEKYPYGLVTKNSISVYAGPGVDYAPLIEAKMLDAVRIYQKRDGWLKIRLNHFGYGWIQEADVAVI